MALDPVLIGDTGQEAANKINSNDQEVFDLSGQNANDITDLQNNKANKANPSTAGNLAALDSEGNVVDSGGSLSSLVVRKGKTSVLPVGTHVVSFSAPMPDTDYINIIQGYLSTGERADPQVTLEDENGFTVTIYLPSIIRYSAGYE